MTSQENAKPIALISREPISFAGNFYLNEALFEKGFVPAGIFTMLVGLPGSGKSYYAKNDMQFAAKLHSSDSIREELFGDVNDQSNQELIFQTLHQRVMDDLKYGHHVVYDATNLNYKRRRQFLQQIKRQFPKVWTRCVFIATPYEVCLQRNAERNRVVPEHVIERMYRSFDPPMYAEGWDEIRIHGNECRDPMELMVSFSAIEHDNPHHKLTIGQHSLLAYYYAINHLKIPPQSAVAQAALLHDIGKPFTKAFVNSRGEPCDIAHFYNHEHVSAYDSYQYEMNGVSHTDVATLIRWHMHPYAVAHSDNPEKTETKIKSFLGEGIYHNILLLHEADKAAH